MFLCLQPFQPSRSRMTCTSVHSPHISGAPSHVVTPAPRSSNRCCTLGASKISSLHPHELWVGLASLDYKSELRTEFFQKYFNSHSIYSTWFFNQFYQSSLPYFISKSLKSSLSQYLEFRTVSAPSFSSFWSITTQGLLLTSWTFLMNF